jgi:hypothetical protein
MSSFDTLSVLDIAFELVSSAGPLSPEQMAETARELGYEIGGREFQMEIEQHLLVNGEMSPFIKVGRKGYRVWSRNNMLSSVWGEAAFPQAPKFILPAVISMALVLALFLIFLAGKSQLTSHTTSATVYLPSIFAEGTSREPYTLSSPAVDTQSTEAPDPSWWFSNPVNQINSDTQEVARQYLSNFYNTCGPAVVAMLASYYLANSESGGGPLTTASVMHDARSKLGYYTPPYNSGLLTFKHLRAMLQLYGFEQTYPSGDNTLLRKEDLLERVRQGQPAIAGMRYKYQGDWHFLPSGGRGLYNHFVVVIGIEEVGGLETLWVANPHPGKYLTRDEEAAPVRMSVDDFWQSWALKDGSAYTDYGHAVFFGG